MIDWDTKERNPDMPMRPDENGNMVFVDSAVDACPTDPQEALQCESCQ